MDSRDVIGYHLLPLAMISGNNNNDIYQYLIDRADPSHEVIFRIQYINKKNINNYHDNIKRVFKYNIISIINHIECISSLNLLFILCTGSIGLYSISELQYITHINLPYEYTKYPIDSFIVRFNTDTSQIEAIVSTNKSLLKLVHTLWIPESSSNLPNSFFSLTPNDNDIVKGSSTFPSFKEQLIEPWTCIKVFSMPATVKSLEWLDSHVCLGFKQEYSILNLYTGSVSTLCIAPSKPFIKQCQGFFFVSLGEKALLFPNKNQEKLKDIIVNNENRIKHDPAILSPHSISNSNFFPNTLETPKSAPSSILNNSMRQLKDSMNNNINNIHNKLFPPPEYEPLDVEINWKGDLIGVGCTDSSLILMQANSFQIYKLNPLCHVQTLNMGPGIPATFISDSNPVLIASGSEIHYLQPISLKLKIADEIWLSSLSTIYPPEVYDVVKNHLDRVLASHIHPFGQMAARFVTYFTSHFEIPYYMSALEKVEIDIPALLSLAITSIHSFLSCIHEAIILTWPVLDLLRITQNSVTDSVFPCIHPTLSPLFKLKYNETMVFFGKKLSALIEFEIKDFGCDMPCLMKANIPVDNSVFPPVQPLIFYDAIELVRQISSFTSPMTKLSHLSRIHDIIISNVESLHRDYIFNSMSNSKLKDLIIAADDLVAIFCYIIVQSQGSQLLLDYQYLHEFVDPSSVLGHDGYILTTLQETDSEYSKILKTGRPSRDRKMSTAASDFLEEANNSVFDRKKESKQDSYSFLTAPIPNSTLNRANSLNVFDNSNARTSFLFDSLTDPKNNRKTILRSNSVDISSFAFTKKNITFAEPEVIFEDPLLDYEEDEEDIFNKSNIILKRTFNPFDTPIHNHLSTEDEPPTLVLHKDKTIEALILKPVPLKLDTN